MTTGGSAGGPVSSFTIKMNEAISPSANVGRAALAALRGEMQRNQAQARSAASALSTLKAGGLGGSGAAAKLRAELRAARAAAAEAQAKITDLGEQVAKKPATWIDRLNAELKGTSGPLSSAAQGLQRFQDASALGRLQMLLPVLAALGAAALATAAAFVALTAAVLRFGIAAADARRSAELHLEGLTRLRRGGAAAAMSGHAIASSIDRVSSVAAIGRDEVTRYAEQLYRMGVRGASHAAALEAVSIAAAAGGDRAASRYVALAAGAARMGRSVAGVLSDARARFGDINARMNLSLGRLGERLRESFVDLFAGSRVSAALERFLLRVGEIRELFSQSSATGRGLRAIVEAIFPSMLDTTSALVPMVRRLFQYAVLGALRATNEFLRLRVAMLRIGAVELFPNLAPGLTLARMARAAFQQLAGQIVAPFLFLGIMLERTYVQARFLLGFLADAGVGAARAFDSLAPSIIEGLERGLRSGAERVRAAAGALAGSISGAFRDALGIRSPSRVFIEHGMDVAAGLAEGVDRGAGAANRAVTELVGAPSGSPTGRGGGSPSSVVIEELHVHTAATDAAGIARDIVAELAEAFHGLALQGGTTP